MKLLNLLDKYLEDQEYLKAVTKIRERRDEVRTEILDFLAEFLAARKEIEQWRDQIQLINLGWGIGRAIPIILGVYNECKEMGRLGQLEAFIRRHMAIPRLIEIKRIEALVDFVKDNYRSVQRLRLLFVLTVFWHIQQPDTYPIFYPKSREGLKILREKGLLAPLAYEIEDYYDQYLDFIIATREIRGILEARGVPAYQVEHFLFWVADKYKN